MRVNASAKPYKFDDAPRGSLLIAVHGNDARVVRGMKVFFPDSAGNSDHFMTLGPFSEDDNGAPGIYHPAALKNRPVLDISAAYRFEPSLGVEHILRSLPAERDGAGLAFFAGARVLLGAKRFTGAAGWTICYVDVATGEMSANIDTDTVYATKAWSFVEEATGRTPSKP